MAAIILPHRWRQQPPEATPVDPAWSVAQLYNSSSRDLFTGAQGAFAGTVLREASAAGYGLRSAGGTTTSVAYTIPASMVGSTTFTVFGILVPYSVSSTQVVAQDDNGGSAREYQVQNASGTLSFIRFNTSNSAVTASVAGLAVGKPTPFVCTSDGTAVTVYTPNGVGTATITATPKGLSQSASPLLFLRSGVGCNGQIPLFGHASRAWNAAQARAFLENPWQVFQPLVRRIWVDMGGGTDTTTPQAQAAYTWAASASAPVIGVVAPAVHASYAWAAAASPPVQATVAPAVSATYSWAATASIPFVATTARPGSDISTTGWTATPGPSYFGMIDEPSADDADYITSPDLSTPITMGLNTAWAAGTYTIRIRAKGASGQIRVVMLSQAGASVGASSYQAVDAAFATYELPVTTTGVATAFRYELAA